jgi:hypothetical protein
MERGDDYSDTLRFTTLGLAAHRVVMRLRNQSSEGRAEAEASARKSREEIDNTEVAPRVGMRRREAVKLVMSAGPR